MEFFSAVDASSIYRYEKDGKRSHKKDRKHRRDWSNEEIIVYSDSSDSSYSGGSGSSTDSYDDKGKKCPHPECRRKQSQESSNGCCSCCCVCLKGMNNVLTRLCTFLFSAKCTQRKSQDSKVNRGIELLMLLLKFLHESYFQTISE